MQTFTLSPEFEHPVEHVYKTQQTPFLLGYVQTRAYWPFPKRVFKPRWQAAQDTDFWYTDSFFREHKGPSDFFLYVPVDPVSTPHRAGDVALVAGGAMSSRTYYYALSWVTAGGETTVSTVASVVVGASQLFKITIPKFPYRLITKGRIYVGTTSGGITLQAEVTTTGGSWTEPDTGLVSGSSPSSSNAAKESVTVHLMNDSFEAVKLTPVSYSMQLDLEEIL